MSCHDTVHNDIREVRKGYRTSNSSSAQCAVGRNCSIDFLPDDKHKSLAHVIMSYLTGSKPPH